MSSPIKHDEFYDASESPIFATPTKRRHGIISLSPMNSPRLSKSPVKSSPLKRGVIVNVGSPFSPVRTQAGGLGCGRPRRERQ